MNSPIIEIINKSTNLLPRLATPGSAGMDLQAFLDNVVDLHPGEWCAVPTGLYMKLPNGYEAQIRPRSGLAFNHGITVLNSPGTIDSDYRGEIKVILINHGVEPFLIKSGDRIAQMVIAPYAQALFSETTTLEGSERGEGGFGHTGV